MIWQFLIVLCVVYRCFSLSSVADLHFPCVVLQVSGEHPDEAAHTRLQQECATLKQRVKDYEIHVKQLQTQLETAAAAAAAATAASVAVGPGSGTTAEARCKQLEVRRSVG